MPSPCLAAPLVAMFATAPAFAAPTLVPTSPLVGDGTTPSEVRLYVEGATKVKVKADEGKVGGVTVAGDGIVTFAFTPPRVEGPRAVQLRVSAGGEDSVVDVPVVPPYAGELALSVEPAVVQPGATALLRIRPSGTTPVVASQRRFVAVASVGTLEAPMPAGDGSWVARYTPPKTLTAPVAALVSVVDSSAPDRIAGHTVVPVGLRKNLGFDVAPGSQNLLVVGERSYGPFKASPAGKVAFDVDLDPRVVAGKLTSVRVDTSKDEREVPLPAGPPQVLLRVPTLAQGASNGGVMVEVLATEGTGRPAAAPPTLTTSLGTLADLRAGPGRTTARLMSPSPFRSGDAVIVGESAGARGERKVRLTPPLASVGLRADADTLAKGATLLNLVATARDASGSALVGVPPVVTSSVGTVSPAKDGGDGGYGYRVTLPASAPSVRVMAMPSMEPSPSAPSQLLAWSNSASVAANGKDEAVVTVVALDAQGLPVPNVELRLSAPAGDGRVVPVAKTDTRGAARVTYTAGTQPGVVGVRVEGAGLSAAAALFQSAGGIPPALGDGGDALTRDTLRAWRGATPEVVLLREGAAPLAGPPAAVQVATVPAFTTPGAAILVTVRVADGAGKGVSGRKLVVNAAPASVGSVTDNRDGTYSFTAQLPPGVDGPLTVTVTADGVPGVVQLPTFGQAAPAPGRVASTAKVGTDGPGKATRTPKGAGGPDLRMGAVLVDTRGRFVQTSDGGAQLAEDASYSPPAVGFLGAGGEVAWVAGRPSCGEVAIDARGSAALEWFRVAGEPFTNVQRDVVLGARVLRGDGKVRFGAGFAAHHFTGVLFRYADAELTEPTLLAVPLYGGRASLGVDVDSGDLHARLELAETFAPAPVDTHLGLLVDWGDPAGMLVRAGASMDWKSMTFVAGDGSEANVTQSQPALRIGVAWAL